MEKALPVVRDDKTDFEEMEERIKRVFRKLLYYPLLKDLGFSKGVIENAALSPLQIALQTGQIVFKRGRFTGTFGSQISKELRNLGARWDRSTKSYLINFDSLPTDVKQSIRVSEQKFLEKISKVDDTLSKILPEEIARSVKTADLFDRAIFKTDRGVAESTKSIAVLPQLSKESRKAISTKWSNNMELWIQDFTRSEIKELRQRVAEKAFQGARYEEIAKVIEESYGVSSRKAKFLASQETRLMVTTLKEARYTEAGINEYRWRCVAGSPNHPVRPSHKILDGKIFSWNDPPITTAANEPQRKNNPGQDYNCRCYAQPIYRVKKE